MSAVASNDRTLTLIAERVADAFGVSSRELYSMRRHRAVVEARQTAMWLARRMTDYSYPRIARAFGDRDHTTVMYGVSRVEQKLATDPDFAAKVRWAVAKVEAP